MRVLWTTLDAPHPTQGGARSHSWELLARASRRDAVTVLCADSEPDRMRELTALGVDVQVVSWQRHLPRNRWTLVWEALRGPASETFREVMPGVRAISDTLEETQRREQFDLVFLWGAELAPVLDVAHIPTACYLPDSHTRYVRRLVHAAPTLRHRMLYMLDAAHTRRWERARYRPATGLATSSASEAEVLEDLTGRRFDVVPLALGDEWFGAPTIPREPNLVTIVAGLDYWPNTDGILWFVRESWPQIKAEHPVARLRVVGRSPSSDLRAALQAAGVELMADVPDARPAYWQTGVSVIPLRLGTGVKNKLIHAFACRAPVVTTSIGSEGTAAEDGVHALIADDPAELAAAVIETLRNPENATRRAEAARRLAEPYRAERAAEALELFWQRTLSGELEAAEAQNL